MISAEIIPALSYCSGPIQALIVYFTVEALADKERVKWLKLYISLHKSGYTSIWNLTVHFQLKRQCLWSKIFQIIQ